MYRPKKIELGLLRTFGNKTIVIRNYVCASPLRPCPPLRRWQSNVPSNRWQSNVPSNSTHCAVTMKQPGHLLNYSCQIYKLFHEYQVLCRATISLGEVFRLVAGLPAMLYWSPYIWAAILKDHDSMYYTTRNLIWYKISNTSIYYNFNTCIFFSILARFHLEVCQ